MDKDKGFLGTLYEFSFERFVTPSVMRILYTAGLVLALLGAFRFIGAGFDRGFFTGILSLIISPALFMLYSLLARVAVELVMVLFRIAEGVEVIQGFYSDPDLDEVEIADFEAVVEEADEVVAEAVEDDEEIDLS